MDRYPADEDASPTAISAFRLLLLADIFILFFFSLFLHLLRLSHAMSQPKPSPPTPHLRPNVDERPLRLRE
jgi:hypothetical protein